MNFQLPLATFFAAAVMYCAPLHASSIVYSNFGFDPGYALTDGYVMGGDTNFLAVKFMLSQTATLDHVEVPLFFVAPNDPPVHVSIFDDISGFPGVQLTDLGEIMVPPDSSSAVVYPSTDSPDPALVLQAGTSYWLVLNLLDNDGNGIHWAWTTKAGELGYAVSAGPIDAPSDWTLNNVDASPAFQIWGNPVPDSPTFLTSAFLLVPFALFGIRHLRKGRQLT